MYDYLIVGFGLYGVVFAHEAKAHGKNVLVIDSYYSWSKIYLINFKNNICFLFYKDILYCYSKNRRGFRWVEIIQKTYTMIMKNCLMRILT